MSPKICIVVATLNAGGAEKAAIELSRLLSKSYEVKIVSLKSGGALEKDILDRLNFHSILTRDQRFIFNPIKVVKELRSATKDSDVIISALEGLPTYLVSLAAPFNRKKLIAWVHTDLDRYLGWIEKFFSGLAYLRYKSIICVSANVARSFCEMYPLLEKRVNVIYHFVGNPSNSLLPSQLEREYDLIFVGRLEKIKGIDIFFLILQQVNSRGFYPRVAVLGDGNLRSQMSAMIEMGAVRNVELVGYTADPDHYMKRSKYIINTSRIEGFGLAIIEGMSCGAVPIIADHLHGSLEIIDGGKSGHVIPIRDISASADLIIDLMRKDSDWLTYSEAAVKRSEAFTPDHTERQWRLLIQGFGL